MVHYKPSRNNTRDAQNKPYRTFPYLFHSIEIGDIKSFTHNLQEKTDAKLSVIGPQKNSLLHIAAEYGQIEIAEALIDRYQQKPQIMSKNALDETPIFSAVRFGHIDMLRLLIHYGSQLGRLNKKQKTLLHVAAECGRTEIMRILIEEYDQSHQLHMLDTLGEIPIFSAVRSGHIDMLRLLIHHGGQLDKLNNNRKTLSHIAAECGRMEIMRILIEEYDQSHQLHMLDKLNETPLFSAVRRHHVEMVAYLLQQSANVYTLNKNHESILNLAIQIKASTKMFMLLMHAGVDWNYINKSGKNAYSLYRKLCDDSKNPILPWIDNQFATQIYTQLFIPYSIKSLGIPKVLAQPVTTELHVAMANGDYETVRQLLNLEFFDVYTLDFRGETPIFYAIQAGYLKIVQLLIERGICNALNTSGATPLHIAMIYGRFEIAFILIKDTSHADQIYAENNQAETALFEAVRFGYRPNIELLLEHNADANVINQHMQKPVHIAAEEGDIDIVKLLLGKAPSFYYTDLYEILLTKHGLDKALKYLQHYQTIQSSV